jgi:NAD(P)-dependent dehydrogenase (short-subunit alcohol dehydrogenase family)
MENLEGRVAFITGGASGIGLGMARAFLAEGMKVAIADLNDQNIEDARRVLAGSNAVHFVRTNVADRESVRQSAEQVLEAFGAIHVLCNNAGVNGGGTAASEDFDGWDRALSVNLGGVVNGTKIIVPIIRRQGQGGHVINTSSMAGMVPLPGLAAYSTAKYAVRGFSESLRIQLAPQGIGVSCLFPGATRTRIVPLPEDDPEHINEEDAPQFMKDLWDAMRSAIDPLDTGRAVVEAIRENRFYIFTNREFLEEVQQRHREIEDAFPDQEPPEGRVKFETMRAEMVRNLMAPGNRPVPQQGGDGMALDLGSRPVEVGQ